MLFSSLWPLSSQVFILLPLSYVVYFSIRALYRVTLHPLARFPGPKYAAFSYLCEAYYEAWYHGRFSAQIDKWHDQYGPIVRVNPNELHIKDPEFYDNLYNFSHHIDRPANQRNNLHMSASFEVHKRRRKFMDPYFSKPAVSKLEDLVRSNVEDFCQQFYNAKGKFPINVSLLARCLTCEIITEYTFAKPYGFFADLQKSEDFFAAQSNMFETVWLFREIWIVNKFMAIGPKLPKWLSLGAGVMDSLMPFIKSIQQRLQEIGMSKEKGDNNEKGHPVLFSDWRQADLHPDDKTAQFQLHNALLIVTAAFETTAYTLETAFYHILSNPTCLIRLKKELTAHFPSSTEEMTWSNLEGLPYLTAVIQECLRMQGGIVSRLPRINTAEDMMYKDYVIPRGTPVGMTIPDILWNPEIFPEPKKFDPERWLKGEESRVLEKKYLVTFSRGARRCLGMHLAYAELYHTLAQVFRRFDMELYETTRKDVDVKWDYFVPAPETRNGVRIVVK